MADAGVVADAGGAPEAAPQQQNGWAIVKSLVFRCMIIYFISSMVRNWRQQPTSGPKTAPNGSAILGGSPGPPAGRNLFQKDMLMDLYVFLSDVEEGFKDFNDSDSLLWSEQGLIYGDWTGGLNGDGSFSYSTEIPCSESLQNNGSIFLHIYFVQSGKSPDPTSRDYVKRKTVYHSRRLNKYKKKRYQKTQNLLTGKTDATDEEIEKADTVKTEVLSHWHPNLTLNLIYDQSNWIKGSLPPPLDEAVRFDVATGNYYPIFFFNDYWNLAQEYQPINDSVKTLNLTLTYAPMSLFKWQMYASQQMRSRWTKMLGTDLFEEADEDQDSLKQAILETNPYLLGLTFVVSLLHTVFEFLAFKNDIQFWRSRKSLEGLSVRSVLFNIFTSLIVLLYVMDNETNMVVRLSIGVGLLIELWKIPKCMDVRLDYEHRWLGVIPALRVKDKGSYIQSSTREYDVLAFKYLSWALFPLLGAYAVYSLMYNEHRGWYSFVLSMLYGFLLTFGFIMMTPQLFINYKLKSVAHLPWRMLSYKFLNTFIDDIFAFVIRMPMMYRIGCFRDDIVFLVYVYQRWIYRVDPSRVNEYGTSGDMETRPEDGAAPEQLEYDAQQPSSSPDQIPNGPNTEEETEEKKTK